MTIGELRQFSEKEPYYEGDPKVASGEYGGEYRREYMEKKDRALLDSLIEAGLPEDERKAFEKFISEKDYTVTPETGDYERLPLTNYDSNYARWGSPKDVIKGIASAFQAVPDIAKTTYGVGKKTVEAALPVESLRNITSGEGSMLDFLAIASFGKLKGLKGAGLNKDIIKSYSKQVGTRGMNKILKESAQKTKDKFKNPNTPTAKKYKAEYESKLIMDERLNILDKKIASDMAKKTGKGIPRKLFETLTRPVTESSPILRGYLPGYTKKGGWGRSKKGLGAPAIGLAHRGVRGLFEEDEGISGLYERYGGDPAPWAAPILNTIYSMYEPFGQIAYGGLKGLNKIMESMHEKDIKKKVEDETKNVLSSEEIEAFKKQLKP